MEVTYLGRKPIDWLPDDAERTPMNKDVEALKTQFIAFLDEKMQRLHQDSKDPDLYYLDEATATSDKKRLCMALRAIALDPEADFGGMTLDGVLNAHQPLPDLFDLLYEVLTRQIDEISEAWAAARVESDNEDKRQGDAPPGLRRGRTFADVTRQRLVPGWYGNLCVLTGDERPHGAHIVPVRVTRNERRLAEVWRILHSFWHLPQLGELEVQGPESTNILPLCPNMHAMWDRYEFALRPVVDPADGNRIFVQLVWLDNIDTRGGLFAGDGDHAPRAADLRRCENGRCPVLQHGDVYAIVTPDAVRYPLPSLRMLQIQYGVHKLMAGMRAARSLYFIFGGFPPDDQGPVPYDVPVPRVWAELLDTAVVAGVLDDAAAERWSRALRGTLSGG